MCALSETGLGQTEAEFSGFTQSFPRHRTDREILAPHRRLLIWATVDCCYIVLRIAMHCPRGCKGVKVLRKSFLVVEAMARSRTGVRVSDLSRRLDQPKATVFRILRALEELGYAQQDSTTRAYMMTDKITWLTSNGTRETLRQLVRPFMEQLQTRFEQTVNLALFDQDQVRYIEILDGTCSIPRAPVVNGRAPLHSTAVGKSILAFLDEKEVSRILKWGSLPRLSPKTITSSTALLEPLRRVRERGYAVDNEETAMGARCVGAPIFSREGRPIAALSVSGPTSHINHWEIGEIAGAVTAVCREVSSQIEAGIAVHR